MEFDNLLTRDIHEAGAEINIIDPRTGEATDAFIKIMGPDSREWMRATRSIVKAAASDNEDEIVKSEIDALVSVTIGWRGITRNGDDLPFSKGECLELYTKSPGLLLQVQQFILDRRNFTKG